MEKLIARWSYWLGIVCMVIAVVWKIVVVIGYWHLRASTVEAATPGAITVATAVGHSMFLHASIMFFVASMASVGYGWLKSQKS